MLLRWIPATYRSFCAVRNIHFATLRSVKVPSTAVCDMEASVAGTFKAIAACYNHVLAQPQQHLVSHEQQDAQLFSRRPA